MRLVGTQNGPICEREVSGSSRAAQEGQLAVEVGHAVQDVGDIVFFGDQGFVAPRQNRHGIDVEPARVYRQEMRVSALRLTAISRRGNAHKSRGSRLLRT